MKYKDLYNICYEDVSISLYMNSVSGLFTSAMIVETAGTCLVLLPVPIYFILNIMSDYPAED